MMKGMCECACDGVVVVSGVCGVVNECLYDEKPALRTGQGTALGSRFCGVS